MPNKIEFIGLKELKERLIKGGRNIEKSDNKTFDLIVDGEYAEVKTKGHSFDNLDFISFTDKQHDKIFEDFIIFLVCNVNNPKDIQIYEFSSKLLKDLKFKKYSSYEYNKTELKRLKFKKLT